MKRLTSALVGRDDGREPSPRVALDLLTCLLSTDFGERAGPPAALLIDPRARWPCGAEEPLVRHLWCAAINWSARCDAGPAAASVRRCLVELGRFLRRHADRFDPFTLGLPVQPWLAFAGTGAFSPPATPGDDIVESTPVSFPPACPC